MDLIFFIGSKRKVSVKLKIKRIANRFIYYPPNLSRDYNQTDFYWFMRNEIFRFSKIYAIKNVDITNGELLTDTFKRSGAVLGFIHYGSFFLPGGAVVHKLGLRYKLMVSRRFLVPEITPEPDIPYWKMVHRISGRLYKSGIFYNDVSPKGYIRWLRDGGLLGAALDVWEAGQIYKNAHFSFMKHKIFMQYGPAHLAQISKVPLIPMSIQYDLVSRKHNLVFYDPIHEIENPVDATQTALSHLEKHPLKEPMQLYHDIIATFK